MSTKLLYWVLALGLLPCCSATPTYHNTNYQPVTTAETPTQPQQNSSIDSGLSVAVTPEQPPPAVTTVETPPVTEPTTVTDEPAPTQQVTETERRWSTTMNGARVNGITFSRVRSDCGFFEVLGTLATVATRRVGSCHHGTVVISVQSGRITETTNVLGNRGGRCLADALSRARLPAITCSIEISRE